MASAACCLLPRGVSKMIACDVRLSLCRRCPFVMAAALAIAVSAGLWAQERETDLGEASASTGIALGSAGTNILLAGAIGTGLDRYFGLLINTSYIPLGDRTWIHYPGAVARSSGLYDFTIDLQIRIPLRTKWEP